MSFRPHKFGRYIIVDPIAVGGMAEIYRARLAAAKEGPDRIIVIKKVIANLQQNTEFLQMFEEEIKITVGLTHPNIIQIYDYGKVTDQYFMAMEYVEGKNLRQFVKRLVDMKSMFSIDMSCYIISQICHALAYAHSYKDRLTGKPLGIVHRDISPQNIMISYDGAVKLFDFGIAKAKSASEATRAGVIKGKPSYLSPEQINGEELDGRCDVFALGIVLWELLTAKRLFVADTDMGVLRLIQSAKIESPSTFNPAVPQSLDAIVLKGLQRDKTKRYQSAEEFQRDLHKFLYSFNPSFNPADLSYYAQELFKNEIRDDRERLTKYLSIEPMMDDGDGGMEQAPKKNLSTKLADGLISTTDFNREMMDQVAREVTGKIKRPSQEELKGSPTIKNPAARPPVPGASLMMDVPSTGSKLINNNGTPAPAPRRPGDNMVIPPWSKQAGGGSAGAPVRRGTGTAKLQAELDQQASSGRNVAVLMGVLLIGLIAGARQFGFLAGTPLDFLDPGPKVANVPAHPRGEDRKPASPGTPVVATNENEGTIVLQTRFTGMRVTVNGKPVNLTGNQFPVPLNTPLHVEVEKAGYHPVKIETTVTSRSPASHRVDFIEVPSGSLSFVTTPDARMKIYSGEQVIFEGKTPLKAERLPVGRFKVVLENSILGHRSEHEVVIEQDKITQVERILK